MLIWELETTTGGRGGGGGSTCALSCAPKQGPQKEEGGGGGGGGGVCSPLCLEAFFPLNCRDFTPNPTPRKAFGSGIRSSLCPGQHCCAGDPNPPAGLGGDEMWGGSVAGASHPLYSLADPFVSSSQPVSLFAASPGKSLLFRFLCRRKNVGLVLVFVLGGGGKAGGRGWKSGIPSGGDAQRWQLRENESNPSNPPPFQPPIRCFQKPHIFFFNLF